MRSNGYVHSLFALALVAGAAFAPAGASAQTPDSTQAPQDSVTRRPLAVSWTADRRDFGVGDILTILVDELTIASADKSNINENDRSTRGTLDGGFSMSGTSTTGRGGLSTGWDTDSRQRGQARRQDRLTTEFSVRVVEIAPNGVLRVEGTRTIVIDEQEQQVTLTGFVRPQDVAPRNVVDSWRVADASLTYASEGDLGKPKQGILAKILGIIWP
jgi:flagellar L-ring protein precursor FlgH